MSITKNFSDYLMESAVVYHFKLCIAAELSKEQLANIARELTKYDADKLPDPKRLPVQRNNLDFPQLGATEISHIDLVLHYPVTTPELVAAVMRATTLPESHILIRSDVQAADALPVPQQDDTTNKTASDATVNIAPPDGPSIWPVMVKEISTLAGSLPLRSVATAAADVVAASH